MPGFDSILQSTNAIFGFVTLLMAALGVVLLAADFQVQIQNRPDR